MRDEAGFDGAQVWFGLQLGELSVDIAPVLHQLQPLDGFHVTCGKLAVDVGFACSERLRADLATPFRLVGLQRIEIVPHRSGFDAARSDRGFVLVGHGSFGHGACISAESSDGGICGSVVPCLSPNRRLLGRVSCLFDTSTHVQTAQIAQCGIGAPTDTVRDMATASSDDDIALARELFEAWDSGNGVSKSELERRTWGDGSSHGRRFDRFVRTLLGAETSRPSKQSDRIADLEAQIRSLGAQPVGAAEAEWQVHLQQARASCMEALRVWNDPTSSFRTGAFALLFVTAWNSLASALLQREGKEWRHLDDTGVPVLVNGAEQSLSTGELVAEAFGGDDYRGTRENLGKWIELRNAVAHRHLPGLDAQVIPLAQSGLLNIENALVDVFGAEYTLGEQLSVPLQLSGFRDPGVLSSLKKLQSSLPPEVQSVLAAADAAPAELLSDPTYMLRVAFIPVVPGSGRSPDSVAYFVPPGEVPTELAETLERYVVLAKPTARPNFKATDVIREVQRRGDFKFNTQQHLQACRNLGVRPPAGEPETTLDVRYAEYISSFKLHLYSQAWIDRLVTEFAAPERFVELTGRPAVPLDTS